MLGIIDSQYYVHIFSNEILMIKYSAKGELLFVNKIPKSFQHPSYYYYSYYVFAFRKDKVYLVFNNRDKEKRKRKILYTDFLVINSDGEIERDDFLFSSKDTPLNFAPYLAAYDEGKRLLIGAIGCFKFNFIWIELGD